MALVPKPDGSACGTIVPAGLVVNQTWTLAGSPYCVQGDIQLSLLTIDPGVCVQVDGDYKIDVLSSLLAEGTDLQPIVFTAKDPNVRWKGIRFSSVQAGSKLVHCDISLSHARGLTLVESAPVVRNCRIWNNSVSGEGGGVIVNSGQADVLLEDCRIEGNTSTSHAGGLRSTMSNGFRLTLRRTAVSGNSSNPSLANGGFVGGGAYITGAVTIEKCTFENNILRSKCTSYLCSSLARGGGAFLSVDTGDAIVTCSTFSNNLATAKSEYPGSGDTSHAYGGGLYLRNGPAQVRNCIVAGNSMSNSGGPFDSRGGGIYVKSGTVDIVNTTIARNVYQGLYREGGTVNVRNSILFFNNNDGTQVSGTATVDYSCVQSIVVPNANNINSNPVFAGPGTQACDIRVMPGSQCIDGGDPDMAFDDACPITDFGTSRNDIGAHGGPANCSWATGTAGRYCSSAPNSTGASAFIGWSGSLSLSANNFTINATRVPDLPGLFFFGPCQVELPFGNGSRCVGGQLIRLPVVIGNGGVASSPVDLGLMGIGLGDINFQYWFRDPPAGGAGFNLSDGLQASFTP